MAKFLATTGVSHYLEELIKNARKRLILISPYIKFNDRLKPLLEQCNRRSIDLRIVYGKGDLQHAEEKWLRSLTKAKVYFCANLHAKCYLSESEAILTSMNLYAFSEINNYEMGIHLVRKEDETLYHPAEEEAVRIIRGSTEWKSGNGNEKASRPESTYTRVNRGDAQDGGKNRRSVSSGHREFPTSGFCIRCGTDVETNPSRPLCFPCYLIWSEYQNPTYIENMCHLCGRPFEGTISSPICNQCHRDYKRFLSF